MKEVTHIDCPKNWRSTNDWDSHREALHLCLCKLPAAKYIEFGVGKGSTPLLLSKVRHTLVSVENSQKWIDEIAPDSKKIMVGFNGDKSMAYKIGHNQMVYKDGQMIIDWIIAGDVFKSKEIVVFVDHAPGEDRKRVINELKDYAHVIIAHDTEEEARYVYGMEEILSTFKYRLDYRPDNKPHTTIVSNFINVEEWA